MVEESQGRSINGKFKFCKRELQNKSYFYGFEESFRLNQFGFTMRDDELLTVGEHQDGLLEGLGRSSNRYVEIKDGVFSNGDLIGIGASFNPQTNKYIFGNFGPKNVDILREGFNWPF